MIETSLRQHLISDPLLTSMLTTYAGQPAVFNQAAPGDQDAAWADKSQYGRIVFAIDTREDAERKVYANLIVDAALERGTVIPEDMERRIRDLIDGFFFSTDEITMAATWQSSQYFTNPTDEIDGVTMIFALYSFPIQETGEMDPVRLINMWTEEELGELLGAEVKVIGKSTLPSAWKPTNESPAIYWRVLDIGKCSYIPDTYQTSWFTAMLRGHVMAQDKHTETKIARAIELSLTQKKRLIFEDMSPLMLDRNIRIDTASDAVRTGQVRVEATYGELYRVNSEKLQHIHVKEG